jgi:hypothetical protein
MQPSTQLTRTILLNQAELAFALRRLFADHAMWTRELMLLSTGEGNDTDAIEARLARNAKDISDIARQFYGNDSAAQTEIEINALNALISDYITAYKAGDLQRANEIGMQMYAMADAASINLSRLNRFLDQGYLQTNLRHLLDMTMREAALILSGEYRQSIAQYDTVMDGYMQLADDIIVSGIRQLESFTAF